MGKPLKTPEELNAKLAAKKAKEQKVEAKVEKTEAPKVAAKKTEVEETPVKVEEVKIDKNDIPQTPEDIALEKELDKLETEEVEETPAIKTADLKAVKKVEPVSVRKVDLVQLAISNASLTVGGFTFKKGEKIAITGRNRKVVEMLLAGKKLKIVK